LFNHTFYFIIPNVITCKKESLSSNQPLPPTFATFAAPKHLFFAQSPFVDCAHMLPELINVYKSANLYHIPMFASVWHSCMDHHYHHDHEAAPWDELSFSQTAEITK
jgi:hypothetical protein